MITATQMLILMNNIQYINNQFTINQENSSIPSCSSLEVRLSAILNEINNNVSLTKDMTLLMQMINSHKSELQIAVIFPELNSMLTNFHNNYPGLSDRIEDMANELNPFYGWRSDETPKFINKTVAPSRRSTR